MSYCRTSCYGSDVYIFDCPEGLTCLVNVEVAKQADIRQSFVARGSRKRQLRMMLGHVVWLRDIGIRIPTKVDRRILDKLGELDPGFKDE